ncbi:MAG: hypothetical protein MHMPM18_000321 [Marteilia pararefringens]
MGYLKQPCTVHAPPHATHSDTDLLGIPPATFEPILVLVDRSNCPTASSPSPTCSHNLTGGIRRMEKIGHHVKQASVVTTQLLAAT